jgi:hypothetical protein
MAQITWRNVDAPNQSVALQGIKQFGDMFGNATKGFGDATATFDNDTRVAAASPAISAYFQAAATGDPRAAQAALTQNAQGFGNLTPDQLSKVFSTGGTLTGAGIGNQAKRFDFDAAMRNDTDQQSAIAAFAKLQPQVGVQSDVARVLNDPAYLSLSPTAKSHVQALFAKGGYSSYAPLDGPGGVTPPSGTRTTGSGFDAHIGKLLKTEGGYAAKDGTSGAPVVYGLNRKHNPSEFDAAMKITNEKGKEAGQAYASTVYKQKYWDTIGGDTLPPELQATALDAAVNQGAGTAKKWLEQSGGDVEKFNALRRERYNELLKDPAQAGNRTAWMNRMAEADNDALQRKVEQAAGGNLRSGSAIAAATNSAVLDVNASNALGDLAQLSQIMPAVTNNSSAAQVAGALGEQWKDIPQAKMLGVVTRIARENNISPALAGEALMRGGMSDNTSWMEWPAAVFGKDTLRGTGFKVDEDRVKALADAIKSPAGQVASANAANRGATAASLTAANEKVAAAEQEYKSILAASQFRPELAASVEAAKGRWLTAMDKSQRGLVGQVGNPNMGQQFPTPAQVPTPVATTTGKVSGAAKVDEMIAEKPAVKPLFNPDAQQTPGSQQARLVAQRQRKADEAAKEAADRAKEVDDLIAEGKARDVVLEARRNRPRVNLAPASR